MVNPVTRMVNIRLYADSVERDAFHGDFMVKFVWRLSGVYTEETC